jgi:uroporphyrinogen decarboxylase
MTSRERVNAAISHHRPDRIPIDLGGFQTGIHKGAYGDLLSHLGMNEEIVMLDPVQQIVKPSEEILRRFRVDTRYITAHAPESFKGGIERNRRNGRIWHDLTDEFGVVWSMPDDHPLYMDISRHPLAKATLRDLAEYPFPRGNDPTRFTGVRAEALRLRQETPYAVCTGISGVVYEVCWYMRGLELWFNDMLSDPGFCEAILDRTLAYWKDFETGFMGEVGDLVDVVMIGDDLAGQYGPLFSPDFYRSVVKPRQKELVQHLKRLTDAKIWYHTCGDCSDLIPDLLDNGIDILNPLQIGPEKMNPLALKEKFGNRLAFWGGAIDSQHLLPFADPETIRREVKKNLDAWKPNGGYVFNNVHNIQAGVPAANIVALFDAAYEFGSY